MELSPVGSGWSYMRRQDAQVGNQGAAAGAQQSGAPADESVLGGMPPVQGKNASEKDGGISGRMDGECQTCKNRKYQDGSDDPGVSYKTPTEIDADSAQSAVRGHEMEHVVRERYKAAQSGRKVVSQSVTIHNAICPECGRTYVSGGTTRTVTKGADQAKLFDVGKPGQSEPGQAFQAEA